MSFLEELSKKLNFAFGETAAKTKEIANVTKLNTSIAARQHEIDQMYTEIGRVIFEREATNPDSPVAALCAKILANQEAIHTMKQQIVDLKNETIENRKARSEAIFGTQKPEEEVEQSVEDETEAVEETEPVAEEAEAPAEEPAPTVEPEATPEE